METNQNSLKKDVYDDYNCISELSAARKKPEKNGHAKYYLTNCQKSTVILFELRWTFSILICYTEFDELEFMGVMLL